MSKETLKLNLTEAQRLQADAAIAAWKPSLELIRKNPRPSVRLITAAETCPACGGMGCSQCGYRGTL